MNIIDFIPTGHENAITRKRLEQITSCDRGMRGMIQRARSSETILNLQDGKGYFRPNESDRPLVERWIRQEQHRKQQIGKSMLGAQKWLAGDSDENVTVVQGYTRRKHVGEDEKPQVSGQLTL